MVGIKNNRRTRYTIDLIKETFLGLLETKKLSHITVTEICKQAEINRGTFYLHYKDPYELFEVMQDEFNQEIMETLRQGESLCTTEESMINLLKIIQDKKTIYQILMSDRGENSFLSQILLEDYLQRHGEELNRKDLFTMDYSFTYMVYGSMGVINQWLESNSKESPQTIARVISSLGHQKSLS
ncbi:TetR/AcrR family transcriptional regulator [Paenibacillus sp. AD87]|uniref:TetR/AcrR family transcriptional regulator n=1 Tax=Paenibacillus sp. AD87 TaxID=1528787 RepID=UPI0007E31779|nr:TetR/AcrR family transcriptional regulator [Paenibacillus sp. AD87]OAX48750.1 HTH-type transcriptional repressor FabR [Paenibacillus sp. AD87]